MFGHLLESGVQSPRRPVWTATSAGAHAALIVVATALTVRQPDTGLERVRPEELRYVAPRVVSPAQSLPRERGSPASMWRVPRILPITLPAVPDVALPSDASTLPALISTLGPGLVRDSAVGSPHAGRVYTELLVERAVIARRDNPSPAYPTALSAAMVEGGVLVQFVVDTTGRVEPQSIVVMRATHRLFGESVQRWLLRTRYLPAEVRGRPVRQLVQQEVGFALRPSR